MNARHQALFWFLAFAGFLLFVYVFKGVLMPFVLGAAVAYLLNPLVDRLGRWGISRRPASLLILSGFLIFALGLIALIAPVLYRQGAQFVHDLPGYLDRVLLAVEPYSHQIMAFAGNGENGTMADLARSHADAAAGVAAAMLEHVAAGGRALAGVVSVLVLMPVVAYFMMKEWNTICEWIEDLLPREHKDTIKGLLTRIDAKISGFVRGQISVAAILAVCYALALSLAGLKYGFFIGLMSGLLSIIPMVGSVVGLLTSITVAWFQHGDLMFVALVAGIFLIGQIVEGNFLTPKLVGESIGMHPLWVFFALMAGGALFGVLGMLLAVPVAAVAGVLLSFAIARYKSGPYYKGFVKKTPKP